MIYTSYFANLKNIPKGITPISICGKAPDWYEGFQYKKLAPKYDFFIEWKETHDNDFYIKCFDEQVLNALSAREVVSDLFALAKTQNIVLLCYEKPDDFCHRHLVANWLRKHGYNCEEFGICLRKKLF